MMNRRLLLTSLLLSGCSVLPTREYQQRRDWPLQPRRATTTLPQRGARTLLVRAVAAGPGMEMRGVQWLLKDGSLNVDYYEQWAVPPAAAMEAALRRWLADSGQFAAVVAPGSRVIPDLILETELTALIADPRAGIARAALSLVLLEPSGDRPRIRLQRTETAEARLAGSDPVAIVAALRDAAAGLLGQVEKALR